MYQGTIGELMAQYGYDPDTNTITDLSDTTSLNTPPKSLVIIGPAGCGKTTWAIINMPKPTLFVTHADDLRQFHSGTHRSIIFDDMDFTHYPTTSQIHLVDREQPRSIHIRYSTVALPAGVVKCFIANKFMFNQHSAIERRIEVVNLFEQQ